MARLLVGLSGGVDSATAAALLQQAGHQIEGAYMRTWMNEEDEVLGDCPSQRDIEDARAVADHLKIPFRIINLIEGYREKVVTYLVEGYLKGETPNPDCMCNREMKFGAFLEQALQDGFDGVATGHYARRFTDSKGHFHLLEGKDPLKDQSYFLALIRQEQLARAFFPVGDFQKSEIRKIAREFRLPNAEKKDSQGICFLGKVPIQKFLRHYIEDCPGPIINAKGENVGTHLGLHRYTIGQRKGIGVPSNTDNKAYVVVDKEEEGNTLRVAFDEPNAPGLYQHSAILKNLSWINQLEVKYGEFDLRVRYRDEKVKGTLVETTKGDIQVRFNEPQRALASGQILAIYKGDECLGGGFMHVTPDCHLTPLAQTS